MKKLFITFFIFISLSNMCLAQQLELTDVIREAREAKMNKTADSQNNNNLTPIKNSTNQVNEQNASEQVKYEENSQQSCSD